MNKINLYNFSSINIVHRATNITIQQVKIFTCYFLETTCYTSMMRKNEKQAFPRSNRDVSKQYPPNSRIKSSNDDSRIHRAWYSAPFASRFDAGNARWIHFWWEFMFSPTAQNGSHSSDSYTVGEFHTRPARNAGESASVGEVGKGIKAFVKFLSCIFSFPPFFPPVSFRFVSVLFFFYHIDCDRRRVVARFISSKLSFLFFSFVIHPSSSIRSILKENRRNLDWFLIVTLQSNCVEKECWAQIL